MQGAAAVGEWPGSYGGVVPSFPQVPPPTLASTSKVVVASWAATAPPVSTAEFQVDVTTYAPRLGNVTRAQLVDVDIPNTQLLVEEAWSRMYFDMGVMLDSECRTVVVVAAGGGGGAATACVLPLPLDVVVGWEVLPDRWLRIYLEQNVPVPITEICRQWYAMNGAWNLVGIPGLDQPLNLLACGPSLRQGTGGPRSFELLAAPEVVAGLNAIPPAALAARTALAVVATALPGPASLARVLTACLAPAAVTAAYDPVRDAFTLSLRKVPGGGGGGGSSSRCTTLQGNLLHYMGFGYQVSLDGGASANVTATRSKGGCAYGGPFAQVAPGDAASPAALALRLEQAFNAFVWPATWNLLASFPGDVASPRTVTVQGGCCTLEQVAAAMTTAFAALVGVPAVTASVHFMGNNCPRFFWSAAVPFSIQVTDAVVAARLGLAAAVAYGPACRVVAPNGAAGHPLLPVGFGGDSSSYRLPPATLSTTTSAASPQLTMVMKPLPPVSILGITPALAAFNVCVALPHGLQPGDQVLLAQSLGGTAYQAAQAVVLACPGAQVILCLGLTPADAVVLSGMASPGGLDPSATLAPLLSPRLQALNLYFQRAPAVKSGCFWGEWANTVNPGTWGGFAPVTYSTNCGMLTSPGTVEITQDTHLLLCLEFVGAGGGGTGSFGIPGAGRVWYPFPRLTQASAIFAKVLRASCFLRCDFDKVYDVTWPGTGAAIGTIRVLLLNGDGTLYQTHGHDVSFTLKLDASADQEAAEWGAGYVAPLLPPFCTAGAEEGGPATTAAAAAAAYLQ